MLLRADWCETHQALDEGQRADPRADGLEAVTLLQVPLRGYLCCRVALPCCDGDMSGAVSIHGVLWEQKTHAGASVWEKSLGVWERLGKKAGGKGRRKIHLGRTFFPSSIAGAWPARAGTEEQVKSCSEEKPGQDAPLCSPSTVEPRTQSTAGAQKRSQDRRKLGSLYAEI